MAEEPAVGALDIGTNTTRCLVARPGPDRTLETLARTQKITRLGQGVDTARRLAPDAIERTLDELRAARAVLDQHGVERIRCVATSASRDAANREDFFDAAEQVLGRRPELVDGREEGRLAFSGATAELDPATGPFLVVDIGGGSTELIVGTTDVEGSISVDIGSVRLTDRFLASDPPAPEELSAAIDVASSYLDDVVREVPAARDAAQLVGVAGTITTVAAVELGMATWDSSRIHRFRLTRAAAEDVFRTLATESVADRKHNPGLDPARADVIVGGCCILVAILRYFDLDGLTVSESDLLDGIARSLLGELT